jgi:hypothetical protein
LNYLPWLSKSSLYSINAATRWLSTPPCNLFTL